METKTYKDHVCFCSIHLYHTQYSQRLDWQTEENLFMSGLRICPKNAKAHYNVAKIANNSETSISHYKKALDLWPSYEHAMNNLGNIYKDQGKFKEAEKLFQKALVISPKFAACWMNLGIVQVNLSKFK